MIRRAIIIGGSITGLLTAKVLSKYFAEVVIVERDVFQSEVASRKGVPQGRHGHLLMACGQELIESIVPEITAEFKNAGLHEIKWGLDTRVLMSGGWMSIADTGIRSFAASRLWLEYHLRKHVIKCDKITLIEGATVTDLCTNDSTNSTITGVRYIKQHVVNEITGDLIVDATGKQSKAGAWLARLGYGEVPTTTIDPKMGYATRWYQKPDDLLVDWKLYISYARPEQGLFKSGAIVEVEENKWGVILGGTNGDYAPTDEEGYTSFLNSLAAPELAEYLRKATPISPIFGFRQTANHWRHYEKMDRVPTQLLFLGDSICSFNPIYGQGMSVSALQVNYLDSILKEQNGNLPPKSYRKIQKQLGNIVQSAWALSATADALLPNATGSKPSFMVLLGQQYITKLTEVMPYDKAISATFLEIMHMKASPIKLFHPRILWKFIRFQFVSRRNKGSV